MSAVSLIASPQCILFCKPFPPPSSKHRVRRLKFRRHRKPIFLASASASSSSDGGDNPSGFSWERLGRSLRFGSERFMTKFSEAAKKETGIDLEDANKSVAEFSGQIMDGVDKVDSEFRRFRFELVPAFIQWNKLDNWKDVGSWDIKRIAVLVLYAITVMVSCVKLYAAVEAPRKAQQKKELTEAYMEALIPEPTPANVRKLKKGMWRKTVPKGLRMKKFIEGSDGSLLQDSSYVGEDAWDNEVEQLTSEKANEMVGVDASLEEKKGMEGGLSLSATQDQQQLGTWRERLHAWKEILEIEKVSDQLVSSNAKYAVEFDMKEVENSLRKDLVEKSSESTGSRALWISKRWWRYRPKVPYMYFLQKLDSSEVAAVVFTEDLKQVYVTMKEGFPLEYIVDIPLDPFLFETISNSAVEVDLLQKRQMHYFLRVVIAILPGIVILCLIRDSMGLLLFVSRNVVRKKYNQLLDLAYSKNFFMSRSKHGSIRKMYREVILGGDVWDLLDEFMHFMDDPMRYYEKGVPFSRGMLLSGPPGTGKTLFARTLAKQCGLPFVFASGADFSDSERSGTARVRELFALARRNTPSFIFVDEIDAVAGKNARKDPRMREAFDELIAQLDGLKERTGVDRFSLSQAFIFICATNRPDEIDPELLRPGRVDRRVYIGLPNERRRVQIFNLHSTRMQLAEDVDFGKLVFRTVGYSGADIRSLVNEAGIMSVRKGHSKICQQDIVDVLDKQLLEGLGVLLTEEEQRKCEERVSLEKKRLLAVHEAGHILLAHLFPTFDWHAFSQLLPGGKETAMSVFYPREEMVECETATYGYMIMQMVVAHGGLCAEKVVFGDVTDGGKDDLNKITRIARELVISPRNERLGFATLIKKLPGRFPSDDNELITYKWDKPGFYPVEMDAEVSELFTRELTRYIQETEDMAMKGLKDNRHILDHIAKELLEKMRITGQEAAERIKELSPVMFEDYGIQLVEMDQEEPWPHLDRLPDRPMDIYPAPLHRC